MLYVILLLAVIATNKVHSTSFCAIGNRDACKSSYTYEYFNGSSATADLDTMCTCRGRACHSSWRRNNFIIKVRLFSDVANLTAKYMFCDRFNLTTCNAGSTALVLSGMPVPKSIVSINCKCPDSNPLFYKTIEWGANFEQHYSYICDSHKIMCEGINSICSTTSGSTNSYPCECPSGYACRIDSQDGAGRCSAI